MPLPEGFYEATFSASEISGIGSGVSIASDYTVEIYVALPGHASLDGQVDDLSDASALVQGQGTIQNTTWADGNVDVLGDGSTLVQNLGASVVPTVAQLLAGASSDAPATRSVANTSNTRLEIPSMETAAFIAEAIQVTPHAVVTANRPRQTPRTSWDQQGHRASIALLKASRLAGALSIDHAFAESPLDVQRLTRIRTLPNWIPIDWPVTSGKRWMS